ncbi:MAG TPA: class I SAM-dependent methyltransferase [Cyclobacteriaceae bacterium]
MDHNRQHWDSIYTNKSSNEVSWTQETPTTSLDFIHSFNIPHNAPMIDVGGGESKLVDFLLDEGYTNITVLDISKKALDKSKTRLGDKAKFIKWVVSDVTEFVPDQSYVLWHDRATFHFLTTQSDIKKYLAIASSALSGQGVMTIGTFSESGPGKCSGLEVKKYSEDALQETLAHDFRKVRCIHEDHVTPFNTVQNFLFCSFLKRN